MQIQRIQKHLPFTASDLLIKEVPVEYIQPGVVISLDEAIGQINQRIGTVYLNISIPIETLM